MTNIGTDKNEQENFVTDLERHIVNNKDLNFIYENISDRRNLNRFIAIKGKESGEKMAPAKIKNNEISSLIKSENLTMAEEIILNEDIFKDLSNEYKLVLADVLNNDKINGQKYLNKIIQTSDDDLILLIARNKKIYQNLSRQNKLIVKEKLAKNPWLSAENLKTAENNENDRRFRTETMKFLFDTKRIKNPLDLLTEM